MPNMQRVVSVDFSYPLEMVLNLITKYLDKGINTSFRFLWLSKQSFGLIYPKNNSEFSCWCRNIDLYQIAIGFTWEVSGKK